MLVSDDAVGYFERNRIFDNRVTGVEIKNEGNPVFIDNEIYGAQASGVIVYRMGTLDLYLFVFVHECFTFFCLPVRRLVRRSVGRSVVSSVYSFRR